MPTYKIAIQNGHTQLQLVGHKRAPLIVVDSVPSDNPNPKTLSSMIAHGKKLAKKNGFNFEEPAFF